MTTHEATDVYEIEYREGDEWLVPVDRSDYDDLRFDGKPRAKTWRPIKVRRVKFDERPLRPCDFPYGGGGDHMPMTHHARDLIRPNIQKYGEFLPLKCDEGEFCTFHVTNFVDALDEPASSILYASDEPGRCLLIHKHVFRPEKLTGAWMFKLPQSRGRFYVTDPFVSFIRTSGLTGLDFQRVWSRP